MNKLKTQIQVREFFESRDFGESVAVTLPLKSRSCGRALDDIIASRNMRHFLNRLNRRIYGSGFKRFDKRLAVVSVLERSYAGKPHFHLRLQMPSHVTNEEFELLIRSAWRETEFGMGKVEVRSQFDDGWNLYITKLKQKPDYYDGFDWSNICLP